MQKRNLDRCFNVRDRTQEVETTGQRSPPWMTFLKKYFSWTRRQNYNIAAAVTR